MKKTVLTFGLIAGLIISVLMDGSLLLADKMGSAHSLTLGYAIMRALFPRFHRRMTARIRLAVLRDLTT